MSQKHQKNASVSLKRDTKGPLNRKVLKKTMMKIKNIESLIGKQSVKWTFSKANRFSEKIPEQGAEYANIKSNIGAGRSAGFGYGRRWFPSNPRGKDAPPSTTYNIPGSLDRKIVGGSISPPRITKKSQVGLTPGPGTYEVKSKIGSGLSCTLKSRHYSLARHSSPPPGTYNPNHSLVESSRYSCIAFGIKSSADNFSRFATPGPGSYDLGSTFSSVSPSPSPKKFRKSRKNSL
jgi:Sperm-tail PG-rich repeat